MPASPRFLLVAASSDAADVRDALQQGADTDITEAASADDLQAAFDVPEAAPDAVVVVPGGPVDDVEVAVYVPDGVHLWVVAPAVPLLLTETAARAVGLDELSGLAADLQSGALLAIHDDAVFSGDGAADASDLSFLTLQDDSDAASGSRRPDSSTSMLDSPFGRPPAPPADSPTPSPSPEADAVETDDPVMIVRAKPDAEAPAPEIPEVDPPEDATVVEDDDEEGQPSVLVVEDNDDTRMLLERILRSTYDVVAVADARSALLAMNECRFAGLVLDINLGGKETGADVLRIARSLPGYEGVFAIALTAYALPGDRERLLEAGFDEYISKPFTRQSLMETLSAGILA